MEIQVDIDELIKLVSTATEAYTTAFLLADNDNRVLKLWHYYSLSDNVIHNASVPFGEGPIGWVAENEKPFTQKFTERDSENLGIYSRNEDVKLIKSFFSVPVMRDEILEGVLSIDSKKAFVFVPKDQKLLSLFAEQFAALINNIRIKRFVDTESSDVSFLNNICNEIARTDNIDSILQMCFDSATKLVESESCLLGLRKNEEDTIYQIEMANIHKNIKRITFSDQDGLAGHVIRTKQAFFHNKRGEFSQVFSPNKFIGRVKSFLGVPMLVKDEVLGIICFIDSRENAFNHRDQRVISILANASALAIANLKAQSKADEFSKNVDGLTGLKSFTGFQENLEKAYQEAIQKRRSLSIIVMDMDNFKRINNLLGYEVGNKVLKRFAQLLLNLTIDKSISVSRFGSDEFAIILPGVSKDQAFSIAGKIHRAVEDPTFIAPNSGLHVSVSFGISSLHNDSSSKNDLIDNALHALSMDKARVIR